MLINRTTKICCETLGVIELKYISYGDSKEFDEIFRESLNDKDFVVKMLFHQLIKPEISFDTFQNLSDIEIETIAKAFLKNEDKSFNWFQDTGNFFKDFTHAFANRHKKYNEELGPIVKSIQETLSTFNKDYSSVIQQANNDKSYISESMLCLKEVAEQIKVTQNRFIEAVRPQIEFFQSTSKIIAESLRPQIDFWQQWADQNNLIFNNYKKYWAELKHDYDIAEQKTVKILRKYKWFITPSFPATFIFKIVKLDKKTGRQDKAINNLFVKFFATKNWRNLDAMLISWKKITLFKKRYKILVDCVEIVKFASKKGINETNAVLPTLITQIDGILTDYLNSKGLKWDRAYEDFGKKIGRKTQFRNSHSQLSMDQLDDLANNIFLNILFQKSHLEKPLATPFNFNRHKIIHGESIKYGRKDYLIRAFMVLDFLAHL